jgi:oxygen-independent coproporphyrinogen-3 oxidase
MQTAELIAKYGKPVPRYTGYPTAPHFSPRIDSQVYAGWLGELTADTPLSLYLHVPFCAELCLFCGCHTAVVRRPEPAAAYARSLLDEIDLLADAIGRPLGVHHIHWDGGTPHALPAEWLRAIHHRVTERFVLRPDAEIAVEVDPRTLDAASLEAFAAIGVTRASLGVQDFDAKVQRSIGRIQSCETTAACAEHLRGIGVRSINLDLMYGLPHQTEDSLAATVGAALALGPDRLAVFGYAHVPWMKKQQVLLPEAALPDAVSRHAQCRAAGQRIRDAGYQPIGLDHFARPTDELAVAARMRRLRRNFQGYTTDDAPVLLGLGTSAIGALPQGYVQNAPAVPVWRDAIRARRLPIARGVALTGEDRLRREVIEHIMCGFAVDLAAVAARHGAVADTLMEAASVLTPMEHDGLLCWSGHRLGVTQTGRPFVRTIAAAFDAYLRSGIARHSAAV